MLGKGINSDFELVFPKSFGGVRERLLYFLFSLGKQFRDFKVLSIIRGVC